MSPEGPVCLKPWRPVRRALTGKVREAVAYFKSRMNDLEKGILVKFTEVLQKAVGIY